jgi:hypothetical protein
MGPTDPPAVARLAEVRAQLARDAAAYLTITAAGAMMGDRDALPELESFGRLTADVLADLHARRVGNGDRLGERREDQAAPPPWRREQSLGPSAAPVAKVWALDPLRSK